MQAELGSTPLYQAHVQTWATGFSGCPEPAQAGGGGEVAQTVVQGLHRLTGWGNMLQGELGKAGSWALTWQDLWSG